MSCSTGGKLPRVTEHSKLVMDSAADQTGAPHLFAPAFFKTLDPPAWTHSQCAYQQETAGRTDAQRNKFPVGRLPDVRPVQACTRICSFANRPCPRHAVVRRCALHCKYLADCVKVQRRTNAAAVTIRLQGRVISSHLTPGPPLAARQRMNIQRPHTYSVSGLITCSTAAVLTPEYQ